MPITSRKKHGQIWVQTEVGNAYPTFADLRLNGVLRHLVWLSVANDYAVCFAVVTADGWLFSNGVTAIMIGLEKAKKIAVVGNSGAGKSTLSRALGSFLGIQVYSIDKIYWLSGWKPRDQQSFYTLHQQWLAQDAWIIDGVGYWDEMERRIMLADVTIFLDVPMAICKYRARKRIEDERIEPNVDITAGCVYAAVEDLQMEVIAHFHRELRPKLLAYLSNCPAGSIRIITTRAELGI